MALFSPESKTQSQVDPMRRDQTVAWQNMMFGQLGKPFQFYPEQTYAEMDPLQQEALGMREQYARDFGEFVDPSMGAWRSMLTAPDVANNPYVQGMLEQQQNLLTRNLQENLLPSIETGAIGAGQMGGTRQGVAEGIALRGTQEALAQQAADTQMRAYLAGLGQQQYGLGATGAMANLGLMPADILGRVGDVYRGEEQRAIDEDMARFSFAQEEPWRRMERFAGSYFPASQPYSTTTATARYDPSALQVGGQIAGIASTIGGMFTGGLGGGGGGGGTAGGGLSIGGPYSNAYGSFLPPSSFGFRGAYY